MATRSPNEEAIDDALSLLKIDHDEMSDLFDRYEALVAGDASNEERRNLAEEICTQLTVHAAIEEEIFYPALRDATEEDDQVDDALAEHDAVKEIVANIEAGDPAEPMYDEMIGTLAELVAAHVQEEETRLFDLARMSSLDLEDLGAQMSARQEVLLSAEEDEDQSEI
jgi:hemerythrin superfamily protein